LGPVKATPPSPTKERKRSKKAKKESNTPTLPASIKRERPIHERILRKRPGAYTRQQALAEKKAEDATEDDDEPL
jgi:hypothetical protein